jgi:hypothetical protein
MLIVFHVWIQSTGALLSDAMRWQPDLGTQQRMEVCRISENFNSTASSRTLCCSFSTTTWIPSPDLLNQAKLFFTAICLFLFLAKAICVPVVFTLIIHWSSTVLLKSQISLGFGASSGSNTTTSSRVKILTSPSKGFRTTDY